MRLISLQKLRYNSVLLYHILNNYKENMYILSLYMINDTNYYKYAQTNNKDAS